MRAIILIPLAAAVGLGVLASQQAATIKDQKQQIAAANEHMEAASLSLQGKCAEQARKMFVSLGYREGGMAAYENHYQTKLNKCMVLLENQTVSQKTVYTFKYVMDAFENKNFGEYIWHTDEVKKYWEVPPMKCNVVALSGEKQICQSEDEFRKLAAAYMNG
ncbi:hypothetical protein [Janthinobacterium sp. HLX7-2]|uniref:hypothetical protein n=1 Tax=Janthinobacterium sp. HLX7-2 TaxID=1259331 RepID=UPI003F1E92E6